MMLQQEKSRRGSSHPFASLSGILGAAGGWALSNYAGASLWIPGAASIVLLLLVTKTRFRPPQFSGAIVLAAGHTFWLLVGGLMTGAWSKVGLDIVAVSGAIAWLWARPGVLPALLLLAIELASLAVNVLSIASANIGTQEHRVLTVHCVLRVLVIVALVVGFWKARRARPATGDKNTGLAGQDRRI